MFTYSFINYTNVFQTGFREGVSGVSKDKNA
jgi:hypothetical protein